jgi:CRP/FNR family cyclic AMP-dependent transcriptional regulator
VGARALSTGRVCELPVAALAVPLLLDLVLLATLHHSMTHKFAQLADSGQVVRLRDLPRRLMAALKLLGNAQGATAVRLPGQFALAVVLNTTRESIARTLRHLEAKGHLRCIDRWHAELSPTRRTIFGEPTVKP